jgi:GT2 family glycosyltransferase/SAM-dependent methyltransferase
MMSRRPCVVRHVDLAAPTPSLSPDPDGRDLFAIFWWRDLPLGVKPFTAAELPLPPAHVDALIAALAARTLSARLTALGPGASLVPGGRIQIGAGADAVLALADPLAELDRIADEPPADAGALTVVVCTRRRPGQLATCLAALAAQTRPPLEILVVDNTEGDPETRAAAAVPGVRYLTEPRPGLSAARNAGVRAARGRLIAFTDDDAVPRPDWTGRLAAAFGPGIDAVTGLVAPARLDTEAQRLFQLEFGGFGDNCLPMRFGPEFLEAHAADAPPVWRIGAGANMAFRAEAFGRAGLFDERLGAGAAGCSEDSEFWYRLLAAGATCLYEPRAVVVHDHRETMAELKAQMRAYMKGHVAALGVQHARDPRRGNLRRVVRHMPRHYFRQALRTLHAPSPGRDAAVWAQFRGWLAGLGWLIVRRGGADPERRPTRKRKLGAFLARNPFPQPLTDGLFYREKMRALHRIAPEGPVRRVLEVGGGRSGLAALMYPGAEVVTVDIDPRLAGQGPADAASAFVCADACRLPFADGGFDAVTLFDVLEHVPDDRAAATEALRVVRPGGAVLVSTPNERWRYPYFDFLKPVCPPESELMAEWGHVRRGYARAELERLFGFAAEAAATFVNPLTAFFHDLAFSRLGRKKRAALYLLAAPVTAVGYLAHGPRTPGAETALRWRRP